MLVVEESFHDWEGGGRPFCIWTRQALAPLLISQDGASDLAARERRGRGPCSGEAAAVSG